MVGLSESLYTNLQSRTLMTAPQHSHQTTPVSQFGKDHWSLLAYVETRCVDGKTGVGQLAHTHMRGNPQTHPLLANTPWKPHFGTRLKDFFSFEHRSDALKAIAAGLMLDGHDDWDCLDDLAAAGYVEILSLANGHVRMTDAGLELAAQLRHHKARGGQFASFVPGPSVSVAAPV